MKHLLQHFKNISTSPQNIDEIKDLILTLAIQGKLTQNWRTQNPNTQSAETLFQEIQKEKLRLVKEKKIKKEKKLPEITKEEIPFAIPNSWKWTRLGEIGLTQTGTTPPKNNPLFFGNFIPFIGPADINNKYINYPKQGLSEIGLSKGRLIQSKSLLMVCIGGSIGKCNTTIMDTTCNQQINSITPIFSNHIYVKIICQSPFFQKSVTEKASGSATPIINKSKWEKLFCPLPPLEEQKQIVTIVEKLFYKLDQLKEKTIQKIKLKEDFVTSALNEIYTSNTIEAWKMLTPHFKTFFSESKNVKELRDTILQLAIQGKLTQNWRAQNPNTQSAEILFEEIQKEKVKLIKEKKIKKEKSLPIITEDEIPFSIPSSWKWTRLGEIGNWGSGSTPLRSNPDFYNGDINWFKSGELNGSVINSASTERITKEALLKTSLRYNYPGYVLIAMYGATIGKTAILNVEGTTNQAVCSCSCYNGFYNFYLHLFLKAYKSKFISQGEGGAQPNISKIKIKNTLCPLPPLEEQKQIVSTVEKLMTLCDQLEKNIVKSKALHHQWSKSISKHISI